MMTGSDNSNTAALAAHGLGCVRGERTIFANVNFSISAGSILLLRGANGCGKSSLLQILAGLLLPDTGSISSQGNAAASDGYMRCLRYVGHGNGIKEHLTAEENLLFYSRFRGWKTLAPLAVLQQAGLSPQAGLMAAELSAGQRRRLALARLLLAPAFLWLLDEPCNALDKKAKLWFVNAVREHCAAGGVAVIAQHEDLSIADVPVTELELVGNG